MGWRGMPFHFPIEISEGAKLAMALYGTAILLVIFTLLCRFRGGRRYRSHGLLWRRQAVPAWDQDGRGRLTARERQLWDDLVDRYATDAPADPPERGGPA